MKVWMIRHGESETNKQGLWTGWLDTPLTEKGREEASRLKGLLSGVRIDKIYSSDLSRATSTADIAIPGCEYELSQLLREINVGSLAGKPHSAVMDSNNKPMNVGGYALFGGESNEQLGARVGSFMRVLESEKHENIAVFTHFGFIKKYLDDVLKVEIPKQKICGKNCLVAVFEYSNSNWSLHSWINLL